MRIAFFSDNFYPELSGISDTIITTGREMVRRGHQALYVGPYYAPREYQLANRQYPLTAHDDVIDGMPIVRLPSVRLPFSPTGQSRFAFSTGASFAALKKFKPDIIHTQSPYGLGHEARRAAKKFRVPLIGTNHTAIEDFFPAAALMRRFDAWYYNHCEFVTAPYQGLLDHMREAGFKHPGQVVANPAVLGEFTSPSAEERAEHRSALGLGEGPVLLYAGRLGVEKRVDVIIRALPALLAEFPGLMFVATGRGAAQPALFKLAQTLGVGKHVRFTGFLSRQALPHVYKAADAFVMMSTSDSQSIALMQGYASGLPALCARARGLPDYTPEACGVLIEPGDHAALAAQAAKLLRDPERRARMGAAAVEYSKGFSPQKIADEWEKIYSAASRSSTSFSA